MGEYYKQCSFLCAYGTIVLWRQTKQESAAEKTDDPGINADDSANQKLGTFLFQHPSPALASQTLYPSMQIKMIIREIALRLCPSNGHRSEYTMRCPIRSRANVLFYKYMVPSGC